MITVRFPSGFSVQYNDANFVTRHAQYSDLLTAKEGRWVAQVPNDAVIEFVRPCRLYDAKHEPGEVADAFERALGDDSLRRGMSTSTVKRIKLALHQAFDARRRRWR